MSVDSATTLRSLLSHAREAASAYHAAQADDLPEQEARWLRQGADEHQQNVRLLTPHIESMLGQRESTSWSTLLVGGKTKVARWIGAPQLLATLITAERELAQALEHALRINSLPVELKALCEDQQACAKTRLSHLKQREQAAKHPGAAANAQQGGPLGHRGHTINSPKPVSTDNSDC